MRYKGYVVTYAGGLFKVNKENYFLNGISRDDMERPDVYDINKDFGRRNIYAVSSGVKCDEDGDELSMIAVEAIKDYVADDFAKEYQTYFGMLNSAINTQTLKKNTNHFEVDTSVLYIENDSATVYNIGDMPVFYFTNGKMEKLSGTLPKTVEVEKNVYKDKRTVNTKVFIKNFHGEGYETVPYISQKIKLRQKAFFVLCSKSVCDVVGEKIIEEILADKHIKNEKKAVRIIDIATENDPEGNYTVQVVQVNKGIPIAYSDVKFLGVWMALALLCVPLYFSGPYIVKTVNGIVESAKAFVENHINKEEESEGDLIWIPEDDPEEEQQPEEDEGVEENDEQGNDDAPANSVVAAPRPSSTPKPQKPTVRPQTPLVQSQPEVQTPEEPQTEVELPGSTTSPETSQEVELPIDFN